MASTSTDEDLVEEREELMVSYNNENNSRPTLEKACFLKPCISSFEGMLRPFPSPEFKASSLSVNFRGWKVSNKNFNLWVKKMAALHKPIWLKSGIYEAIEASTHIINKNPFLILSLAHNWCSETNTFVFPWGEATITLEDVNVILGFSISGSSVFDDLKSSEMEEAIEKLETHRKYNTNQDLWISSFVDDKMEHEAFLALWLSKFVFPDHTTYMIPKHVIPIAVRLARGERFALAPAVLAILYRDLGKICSLTSTSKDYWVESSLFKLVQVWIWERFKNMRPEAKEIQKGEPRIAQWSGLNQKFKNVGMIPFDGNFEWRPYTQPLKNWNPPRFYLEDAKWVRIDKSLDIEEDDQFEAFARFARVSKLVGTGSIVENYYPNRVARQFGFAQDFPVLVTNHSSEVTKQEAWDDYNRSLDGLKLYVPSRFATALVTARYQEWWTKSLSEMQKKFKETFNVGSKVDRYDDDDDTVLKVLTLSQVQKLDDGMMNKRARKDDENAETDDDDNMTIADRSRKKCNDVESANNVSDTAKGERSGLEVDNNVSDSYEGDKSRLEVDNNVSGLQAFEDETVALQETEKKHDENNTSNGVTEQQEDAAAVDERLKQRKLAIWDLALKIEARVSKVENTLAEIKQWKLRQSHTTPPAST